MLELLYFYFKRNLNVESFLLNSTGIDYNSFYYGQFQAYMEGERVV